MGLYKEAISLALRNNKLDIAKTLALKPESEDVRKKMWLKVIFFRSYKKEIAIVYFNIDCLAFTEVRKQCRISNLIDQRDRWFTKN